MTAAPPQPEELGKLDEYALDLLCHLRTGEPLKRPQGIEESVRRIIASLPERQNEDVETWAERLAVNMAQFTD